MGSTSKIPLHKGKKASRPLQVRWGACISKAKEAAEGLMGSSKPRLEGSVAGHCHHQSPASPLSSGSAGGVGAGHQAEQVNQRNVKASAGGRRWEGALRILRGIVMLWGILWWEWEQTSVLGPGTLQINSIPRTSEFLPVLSHYQD